MIYIQGTPSSNDTLPMVLWDNIMSQGTITASTTDATTVATNVGTETTFDYWKPTALPAWSKVDAGSAKTVDSFAIVAHNLGSSGSTIILQYSTDNSTWNNTLTVVPTDDTPILGIITSVSARYWRVYITGSTIPYIGIISIGQRLVLPGGVKPGYTPIWQAQKVELLQSKSLGGQFLGNRILRQGAETSIGLVSFSRTFAEADLQSFKGWYNGGHAFIWASGPSVFTKDVGYCWRKPNAEMRPTFTETGNWVDVTMEVEAYVQ